MLRIHLDEIFQLKLNQQWIVVVVFVSSALLFVLARIFMALHEIFFRLTRLRQVKISICLDSVLATDSDYLTGPGVVQ